MGPPPDLVLALARELEVHDFVETGTFKGDTAAWAARHFESVFTIELSSAYHAAALARFEALEKVKPLQGDSKLLLAEVVQQMARPALFWLDAHWSGLDTAGREAECPLLDEIAVINESPLSHVILVDDARLFCAPPPKPHRAEDWPGLGQTLAVLEERGRRFVVIVDDALVAVPITKRDFLIEWLQNRPAQSASKRWWWRGQ